MFQNNAMNNLMMNPQAFSQSLNMMNGMMDNTPNAMFNPALFQNMTANMNEVGATMTQTAQQNQQPQQQSLSSNNVCAI